MLRIFNILLVVFASTSAFAGSLQFRCQMYDAPYARAEFNLYSPIEGTQIPGYPGYGTLTDSERAQLTETVRSTCNNWARAVLNSYSTAVYRIGYAVVVDGAGYLWSSDGQMGFNIVSSAEYIYKTSAPSTRPPISDCGVRNGRLIAACR